MAAASNIQSPTLSRMASRGEIEQLARRVEQLNFEVTRMHQDCNLILKEVVYECVGQQVCLDTTVWQLPDAYISLRGTHRPL